MSNQNISSIRIQESFQDVIQAHPSPSGSADVRLYDLTGNEIQNLTVSGSLNVSGSLTIDGVDQKCFTIAMAIALG